MQEEGCKESFYFFHVSGRLNMKLKCLSCLHSYHSWYRLCVLIFQVVERRERRSFRNSKFKKCPAWLSGTHRFLAGQVSF